MDSVYCIDSLPKGIAEYQKIKQCAEHRTDDGLPRDADEAFDLASKQEPRPIPCVLGFGITERIINALLRILSC